MENPEIEQNCSDHHSSEEDEQVQIRTSGNQILDPTLEDDSNENYMQEYYKYENKEEFYKPNEQFLQLDEKGTQLF